MSNEEIKNTLIAVCNTLNVITVEGVANMDRLLGAYSAIQQVVNSLEKPADTKSEP